MFRDQLNRTRKTNRFKINRAQFLEVRELTVFYCIEFLFFFNLQTLSNLNDGELKALLDEAMTYKNPKDREGKSKLFKVS